MHEYARHFVASIAAQVLPCGGNTFKAGLVRQLLPYCISKVGDGRYILLNREYKPLGWPTRRTGRVDYGDPMFDSMRVDIDDSDAAGLPWRTTDSGTFFYLYGGDEPAPWVGIEAAARYSTKLRALFGFRVISREGASP